MKKLVITGIIAISSLNAAVADSLNDSLYANYVEAKKIEAQAKAKYIVSKNAYNTCKKHTSLSRKRYALAVKHAVSEAKQLDTLVKSANTIIDRPNYSYRSSSGYASLKSNTVKDYL
jgi:hypothetical protein